MKQGNSLRRFGRDSAALKALPWLVGAVAIMIIVPAVLDGFWLYIATSALTFALIAQSVGIVTGLAGMMTLCQLSFAGIGAWVVAWLSMNTHLPFLLQLLIGAVATVPFGVVIGLPALRLRGINLAVVTLAFAAAVSTFLLSVGFPGADTGKAIVPPEWLSSSTSYFLLCWITFVLVSAVVTIIRHRRLGAAWISSRYSERATAAAGRSVTLSKLSAFATGAFIAGLAGGLMGGQIGLLTSSSFEVLGSLTIFAAAIMVGGFLPEGALIAGVLTAFLPEILRRISVATDLGTLLFAVGAIDSLRRGGNGGAGVLRDKLLAKRQHSLEDPVPSERLSGSPVPKDSATHSSTPLLEINGISVRYGNVLALDSVSLVVPSGAIYGLIGPNGAGKSTLIDVVSGFVTPGAGSISLGGMALDRLAPNRRAKAGLRRTFQQDRTIPDLDVGDYVSLVASRSVPATELDELLGELGGPNRKRRLGTVNLATRRLVELAAAIASRPKVLLLDEPAAGLTPDESRALADVLLSIPGKYGSAILLVEHDVELVQRVCSQITVLDFGKELAAGPPAEVLKYPEVVDAYLGKATVGK